MLDKRARKNVRSKNIKILNRSTPSYWTKVQYATVQSSVIEELGSIIIL